MSKCILCGKHIYQNIINHCHNEHPKKKYKWKDIWNSMKDSEFKRK